MFNQETREKIIGALSRGLKVCGGCRNLEEITGRQGTCVNVAGYPGRPRDIAHMAPNSRGCFSEVSPETLKARLNQAFPESCPDNGGFEEVLR